jgi:D-alanyl-D-alanine carboxypeptidase
MLMLRRVAFASVGALFSLFLLYPARPANAQGLPPELQQKIDQIATDTLTKSGAPSVSIAVVKDGRVAYVHAYGNASLDPATPAKADMRYSIGSVSKQFTATAVLLLQEQGKLSLDDKVAKFIPGLAHANEVSIRQLLSHTSGYQDYWPQDYVFPMMLEPVTAQKILDIWANKPLDFEPGTQWQYSNTNYVIAGVIVEKASSMPLVQFLQEKVFLPLGMKSVTDVNETKLGNPDPTGYLRYALGPLRPAPKEGKGWLFAAGELAMSPEDLAKWDVSIIDQMVLKPASYLALESETLLKNGMGTQYGLGIGVHSQSGHRALAHSGGVSGFTSQNMVFPDDRAAVVAFTNEDASNVSAAVARAIAPLLLTKDDPGAAEKAAQARKIFDGLQHGQLDRSLFTSNANSYFDERALQDLSNSLGPLGTPEQFVQVSQGLRGGMKLRVYSVHFSQKTLQVVTYEMPDGKLEQYQVELGL